MEQRLYAAAALGNEAKVKDIIRSHPLLRINLGSGFSERTVLHYCCEFGRDSMVAILLAHPAIDVNKKDSFGNTPFNLACLCDRLGCVRLLLNDSKVKANETDTIGYSPLRVAALRGHTAVIRWWVASGRDMDLGEPGNWKTDAIAEARSAGKLHIADLLERFKENPDQTRHEVRAELGFHNELAAEVFALMVFLSDGLLEIRDENTRAARFFKIAQELPLELQGVLCYRLAGSTKEVVNGKDAEVAFKFLTKKIGKI